MAGDNVEAGENMFGQSGRDPSSDLEANETRTKTNDKNIKSRTFWPYKLPTWTARLTISSLWNQIQRDVETHYLIKTSSYTFTYFLVLIGFSLLTIPAFFLPAPKDSWQECIKVWAIAWWSVPFLERARYRHPSNHLQRILCIGMPLLGACVLIVFLKTWD